MPEVKFVIMGFGFIGQKHAALLEILPNATLTAIIDPNIFSETIHQTPVFNSFPDFLQARIAADIIIVASPNYLHAEHTLLALQYNYPVICEKPLALSVADAQHLLETAKHKSLPLYCVQQLVFGKLLIWVKDLINYKKLGDIYKIQVNAFWNRDARYYANTTWRGKASLDGGPLFTQFSHFVQILVWLFGELEVKDASFHNFRQPALTDYEDSGDISFAFNQNRVGHIHYSTAIWDKNLESSLLIIAEKGSLKISGQYLDKLEYLHAENISAPDDILEPVEPLAYSFLEEVVKNTQTNKHNYQSAEEAIAVVNFIQDAYSFK